MGIAYAAAHFRGEGTLLRTMVLCVTVSAGLYDWFEKNWRVRCGVGDGRLGQAATTERVYAPLRLSVSSVAQTVWAVSRGFHAGDARQAWFKRRKVLQRRVLTVVATPPENLELQRLWKSHQ